MQLRGHNIHKYVPQLPGQETATFPIKHNNEIRDPSELPTSDIVIIGAGPSAMDMVQEACITQKATNVHVVARIAHWYVPNAHTIVLRNKLIVNIKGCTRHVVAMDVAVWMVRVTSTSRSLPNSASLRCRRTALLLEPDLGHRARDS